MKPSKNLISLLVLLSVFTISFTQGSQEDTLELHEVVVTGTPVKVNKNNIPMAVTVVNHKQMAESNKSELLSSLNGKVPGLFVTERGVTGYGVSTGAAGQISIRGIGGSPTTGVLMLIDGHPQFMGIFGHPLADSYVTSDAERVEVIRGPASILYGSNAMGGVINIITKKQNKEGLHGTSNISYGSFNTQKYMAAAGYKKNKLSLFASVNHDQTDGHRIHSDFKITNGYLKAGYEINKNLKATTDFSIAKFKATDPGPDTINAVSGNSLNIMRGYWALTLDNDFVNYSGTAKVFYNFGEHKISDGFHSKDANYGINIFESVKLFQGNNITLGGDYLNYGGKAENEKAMNGQGMVFKDTTIFDAGIYGFIQQVLFDKLTLNGGIRLQQHEVYGSEWIPAGGFAFMITRQTTWKASVSKGFRSPTIQELYIWNHNPDLSPESIMSYETGILHSFLNRKINMELTGYIIEGENLIVNVPMEGLKNAGKISNKGIEFAANILITNYLGINITYSYIDMKKPVYATPKHNFYSSIRYKLNKFQININAQYINNLDTDSSSSVYFESFTLLSGKISYDVWNYISLFVDGENLLNEKYETNRYYTMPGTTLFGGISINF